MRFLVGYTGFVGSNLCRFIKFDKMYNSKNFSDANGMECDELYFCGLPAEKWKANKFPENDDQNINKIKEILLTMRIKRFILISTIDVYDNTNSKLDEDYIPNYETNNTYGKNRYLFEIFVRENFENHHIFRLPALFGMGLKKNIIFDLLNNNQITNIPINSKFQWYNIDWLYEDIKKFILLNVKLVNLFTGPLETNRIISLFDYNYEIFTNTNVIEYDITTKYADSLFDIIINTENKYIKSAEECIEDIIEYIKNEKIDKSRLRVSNIFPKHISQLQFMIILKCYGIKNVQIAPTTLTNGKWNFDNIDLSILNNLKLSSLQSITYGIPTNIFRDNTDNLLEHLKKVINFASINNVQILVFGCPKTRDKNPEDNITIFVDFFRILSDYCKEKNIIICLEPNSIFYTNFMNKIEDTGNIVRLINNDNIKLMIDIGHLDESDLEKLPDYIDIIYNIDISFYLMKPFVKFDNKYFTLKKMLDELEYKGMFNLEMISDSTNSNDELKKLNNSLHNFIRVYH